MRSSIATLVWLALPLVVGAQVPPEKTGQVETLALPPSPHWVWATDPILERAALVDLDQRRLLGILNGGYGTLMPLFSMRRSEVYVPATYYSRRSHGERTDVVEIYDLATLGIKGEVVVPPKRATDAVALAHSALSDDERFLALFNWTTGTSFTVVDMEERRVSAEIDTPGCSLVYAAGPRRFFSLCPDGSAFVVRLREDGSEESRERTAPFFSPRTDPITEKAVRGKGVWYFVSFEGQVYAIDTSGPQLVTRPPWPLFGEGERKERWRVGGMQHLALHRASGRLYVLVHQGEPDTHKEAGSEVWVYDVTRRERLQRIVLQNPGLTVYGFPIEFGHTWPAPFDRIDDWVLSLLPAGVTAIQVTQDEHPLLVTGTQFSGSLGLHDAGTGEFRGRSGPAGWINDLLFAPWGASVPE